MFFIFPSLSKFILISAAIEPSLIIEFRMNSWGVLWTILANKIKSLSLISAVEICKSSMNNWSLIKDFKDIFVLMLFMSISLFSINICEFLVLTLILKLYGFSK